ncbi:MULTISPECIES: nuclear transport factor 2 family protein [Ralstonia]|uniref:Nuclear transport factor 2 family protein n=1 Tax=Ralstonia mojiangensis TaxID=2953895 RepID=A0AAE3LDZ5_9RALS|nr:nuclear transport factor 2 family protein [Ralstonia mojiangensis]MCO5411230.1 nuclear transport factor 2 family protein [Ralstonia mojiangensis]MCT7319353.1 nuclear transport factor 2 family protein [Ralstonia mojiangensis]MCT7325513.1 nuclear transport factor 2 family protein [Ralstonia mojiangensis]
MNALENKQILQAAFAELAVSNAKPFVDLMADDFSWVCTGTTQWSRRYAGKQTVLGELFAPLRAKLGRITTVAHRFTADGDTVVVEAQGRNTTRDGVAYNNQYCFVIRMQEGKMHELIEYFDTDLVNRALGTPVDVSTESHG